MILGWFEGPIFEMFKWWQTDKQTEFHTVDLTPSLGGVKWKIITNFDKDLVGETNSGVQVRICFGGTCKEQGMERRSKKVADIFFPLLWQPCWFTPIPAQSVFIFKPSSPLVFETLYSPLLTFGNCNAPHRWLVIVENIWNLSCGFRSFQTSLFLHRSSVEDNLVFFYRPYV